MFGKTINQRYGKCDSSQMTVEQRVESSRDRRQGSDTLAESDQQSASTNDSKSAGGRPSKSEIFDLVSSERRRLAIHYCKEHDDPVELADLAEYVASRELEKEVSALTSDERKRVYTSLQQTHLPRLERAGMITDDRGTIELTDNIADLEIYLDIVPKNSVPWGIYYLGLSVISALILGLVYVDILPTATISEIGWAAVILAVFGLSAIAHTLNNREYRLDRMDDDLD